MRGLLPLTRLAALVFPAASGCNLFPKLGPHLVQYRIEGTAEDCMVRYRDADGLLTEEKIKKIPWGTSGFEASEDTHVELRAQNLDHDPSWFVMSIYVDSARWATKTGTDTLWTRIDGCLLP